MSVIRLENVSKQFHLHRKRSLLAQSAWMMLRRRWEPFWALNDVSFSIDRGETVGIVGGNGAGKSTLLGVIAGVTHPTRGKVERSGRISALLELGAGFHPDLSGRENIALHGSLIGLSEQEIRSKMDTIIDFSEMEQFIDEPLRTYSSGMLARIGFSVAVHVEPDVLVLDEVMAVGDAAFQNKCIEHVGKMAASGVTLLFVSHAPGFVKETCRRAIWLEHGRVRGDGPSEEIIDDYEASRAEAVKSPGKALERGAGKVGENSGASA